MNNTQIHSAVAVLRQGGLVAIPTETVYGLGADASNPQAAEKIFAAKGRPADHPLIVHIAGANQMSRWASQVTPLAQKLASLYWPGPLTLILNRHASVSKAVTGGLDTIALRVPAHPLCLSLLKEFAGGIAAPSANRFGGVSPTTAAHVREELGEKVDLILDGGACTVGIESTIVDARGDIPRILRPGAITAEMLQADQTSAQGEVERFPGQHASHYAPKAQVLLVEREALEETCKHALAQGLRTALLNQTSQELGDQVLRLELSNNPEIMARDLYAKLRLADALKVERVLAVLPEDLGLGRAIRDRLVRAAGPKN